MRRSISVVYQFKIVLEGVRPQIWRRVLVPADIRLLALMVIANWTAKRSSLIAIDEPENGVHPHLSEHIVQVFRTASEERQLIVTAHNPAFLDHLEPQEVILCDKKGGVTKVHRASDVQQIETFRKRFQLGELWVQGVLESIP